MDGGNLAKPASDTVSLSIERSEPLTERVATILRQEIISGRLAPGAWLSVPDLARRLGVSRTPTREALLILEREGLASTRSTAGMSVISGDARDVLDLLDIREGLEAIAARRAAERIGGPAAKALLDLVKKHEAALSQNDLTQHVELDARFHAMISDAACNERLARQLIQIEQQLRVLNNRLSRAKGWSGKAVIRDHTAIAKAIAAHLPDQAEAKMRQHIERVRHFSRNTDAAEAD